jgi:hypothetical protein
MMRLLGLIFVLCLAPQLAGADIVPSPSRPTDWDEHPPPSPVPPPEKELPQGLSWVAAALFVVIGSIVASRVRIVEERAG